MLDRLFRNASVRIINWDDRRRLLAFKYLTDFGEIALQDVITKLEPDLFLAVTGLRAKDFHMLVRV